jgi:hypothetical protein
MMTAPSKVCSKCGEEKSRDCFTEVAKGRHGLASQCKVCLAEISRRSRAGEDWKNTEFGRMKFGIVDYGATAIRCVGCTEVKEPSEFYQDSSLSVGVRGRCRLCCQSDARNRSAEKPLEERRAYARAHYAKHSEKIRAKLKVEIATPRGSMDNMISSGVGRGIKRGSKNGRRSFDLVGYSLDELMAHLESKFEPWMTWENYGRGGWHVDHVRPLASFSYETPDDPDFKKAWALSNLQPLGESENIAKGAKWVPANDNFQLAAAA